MLEQRYVGKFYAMQCSKNISPVIFCSFMKDPPLHRELLFRDTGLTLIKTLQECKTELASRFSTFLAVIWRAVHLIFRGQCMERFMAMVESFHLPYIMILPLFAHTLFMLFHLLVLSSESREVLKSLCPKYGSKYDEEYWKEWPASTVFLVVKSPSTESISD